MDIIRTRDQAAIKYLKDFIGDYVESEQIGDYTKEDFIRWFRTALANPFVHTWIAIDKTDEHVFGYVVAQIQQKMDSESLTMLQFYGENEDIEIKLIEQIKIFCKDNALSHIGAITKFPKKYKELGFEVVYHTLRLEV